jgi:hypothetical protein
MERVEKMRLQKSRWVDGSRKRPSDVLVMRILLIPGTNGSLITRAPNVDTTRYLYIHKAMGLVRSANRPDRIIIMYTGIHINKQQTIHLV